MPYEAPFLLVHTYAPHSEEAAQGQSDDFVEAQARAARILWTREEISGIYLAGGRFAADQPTTLAERYAAGIRTEISGLREDQLILHHQAYSTGGELRPFWRYCLSNKLAPADLAFPGHRYVKTIIERRAPPGFRQATEFWNTEQLLFGPGSTPADHRLADLLLCSSEYQHLQQYLAKRSKQYQYPLVDLVLDQLAAILGPRKFPLEGKAR